jgi:hypothetical protein
VTEHEDEADDGDELKQASGDDEEHSHGI